MKFLTKKTMVSTLALVGSGAVSTAAPLLSIGDSVDIFFNGSTNAQWRSNLFYTDGIDNTDQAFLLDASNPAGTFFQNPNFPPGTIGYTTGAPFGAPIIARPKEDAFVFYVSPGVEINIGRNSNFGLDIYFREDFLFYTEFSDELNTELANLYVDGYYNWGNLMTEAGFSFVQQQQNSPQTSGSNFVANLVQTNNYNAYVSGDYDISPKAWVRGGFDWDHREYTNNDEFFNAYSDYDRYTASASFFWRVTPKLSVGPSFRYRYTDPSPRGGAFNPFLRSLTNRVTPPDYNDYFFNVAVEGEVLPKLTLGLNLGYQLRDPARDRAVIPFLTGGAPFTTSDDDRGQFSVRGNAQYSVTPKLTTFLDVYNDFGVGAQGQTTTNLGGDIGAIYEINSYLSSNVEFGMERSDYQNTRGREDITTTAGVSLSYVPDVYWEFSLGYFYINNASDQNGTFAAPFATNSGASFNAHTINLQATLRY